MAVPTVEEWWLPKKGRAKNASELVNRNKMRAGFAAEFARRGVPVQPYTVQQAQQQAQQAQEAQWAADAATTAALDSDYESKLHGINTEYEGTKDGIIRDRNIFLRDIGYGAGFTEADGKMVSDTGIVFDDPNSRAGKTKFNYDVGNKRDATSYAARGQGLSGAYLGAQRYATRNFDLATEDIKRSAQAYIDKSNRAAAANEAKRARETAALNTWRHGP